MPIPRILVVDDDRTIRYGLTAALEEAGYEVQAAEGVQAARKFLEGSSFDAVLLDIRLKDGDGLTLLDEIRATRPQLPVIMATAFGDSERTIRAMKSGAFEYVTKPFDLDVLLAGIARAVRAPAPARVDSAEGDVGFVGSSPAMLEVWKAIGRAAVSNAPVLITGESGVGKELVARAIHEHGDRHKEPFVAVNIAALPSGLVESELFGHERGAFTGASNRREGRFELASRGTLFLDEIGDLEMALQTKLLRVLEDGGFELVGGTTRKVSDARIIAATSRPVTPGRPGAVLREDLYYRLGVIRIEVPPLRARRMDIPLLVDAFLRRSARRRAVSEGAMRELVACSWPGNVRQLMHVIESACAMSGAEIIDIDDLQMPEEATPAAPEAEGPAGELDLRSNLERLERKLIETALTRAGSNRAQAARLLGIRRALLYARLKHFGMGGDAPED